MTAFLSTLSRGLLVTATTAARPTRTFMAQAGAAAETELPPVANKEIMFIRHGVTEMNEHLGQRGQGWGSPGFVDAGFYDTRLTVRGVEQATTLGQRFLAADPGVALLVASPLTRALDTATLAFADGAVSPSKRSVVSALCAERLYLSSDVGRPAVALAAEFPAFDFSDLLLLGESSHPWWFVSEAGAAHEEWRPEGTYCCSGEPQTVFEERLGRFKAWLSAQPESRVAVVAHWGVIHALTGRSLENCEVLHDDLYTLLARPLARH